MLLSQFFLSLFENLTRVFPLLISHQKHSPVLLVTILQIPFSSLSVNTLISSFHHSFAFCRGNHTLPKRIFQHFLQASTSLPVHCFPQANNTLRIPYLLCLHTPHVLFTKFADLQRMFVFL